MTQPAIVDRLARGELVLRRSLLAILARILMLVACVPLLQPTGFCICKFAVNRGGSTRQATFSTHAGPSVASPCTACCNTSRCPEHASQAAAPQAGRTSQSSQPAPTDERHMPGCPASNTAEASKWVEPTPPLPADLPPSEPVAFPHFKVVAVTLLTTPPPYRSSAPPLYLSHCSLVI